MKKCGEPQCQPAVRPRTLALMTPEPLELLVVPTCFVLAGILGLRLGTPRSVATGLIGVGGCHLSAFVVSDVAQAAHGVTADLLHVGSQGLFALGFASRCSGSHESSRQAGARPATCRLRAS